MTPFREERCESFVDVKEDVELGVDGQWEGEYGATPDSSEPTPGSVLKDRFSRLRTPDGVLAMEPGWLHARQANALFHYCLSGPLLRTDPSENTR